MFANNATKLAASPDFSSKQASETDKYSEVKTLHLSSAKTTVKYEVSASAPSAL